MISYRQAHAQPREREEDLFCDDSKCFGKWVNVMRKYIYIYTKR